MQRGKVNTIFLPNKFIEYFYDAVKKYKDTKQESWADMKGGADLF